MAKPHGSDVTDGAARPSWARRAVGIVLAVLVTNALAYVVFTAVYVDFPYDVHGWAGDHILFNAWQVAHGEAVFVDPAHEVPTAFLYTPVYTWMLAPFVDAFGLEPWTGRALTLVGFLVASAALVVETRRRVRRRALAWCAPGVLLLFAGVVGNNILWIHPDVWATAWVLVALIASRRAPRSRGALLVTVLAAVAALYTKQTSLGAVVAVWVALMFGHGRVAWLYAGSVAALSLAVFAALQWTTDSVFLTYMLLPFEQSIDPSRVFDVGGAFGLHVLPFVVVFAAAWRSTSWRALAGDVFVWALVLSLPFQFAAMLKANGWLNNLFASFAVAAPPALGAVEQLVTRHAPGAGAVTRRVVWAVVLFVVARAAINVWVVVAEIALLPRRIEIAERVEQELDDVDGPVWFPHRQLFALRAGRPVRLSAAMILEFRPAYPEVDDRLLADIRARRFEAIFLPNVTEHFLPWDEYAPIIREHYRVRERIGEAGEWYQLTPLAVLKRKPRRGRGERGADVVGDR